MTEGEVCLDGAKTVETQQQTQLGHALAAKIRFLSGTAIHGSKMKAVWLSSEPSLGVIWGISDHTHMSSVGAKAVSTTIITNELEAARAFYEMHFGARAAFDCGWYVVLRFDQSERAPELCLMEPREGMKSFGGGAVLNIKVDDVDAAYANMMTNGAPPPAIALEDHPWGDRGFGMIDPAGCMAYVYTPIEPSPEFKEFFKTAPK